MINSVFLLLVVLLLVYSGVTVSLRLNILFKYQEKVNWIKRKSKLLEALLVDHDLLKKEQKELASQIRSFWGIEDLSLIYLRLNKEEESWLNSTRSVVNEAEGCCSDYDKQSPRSIWGLSIFGSMTPKGMHSPKNRLCRKQADRTF
ncbi:hypothetical protein MtrunA17_Chr1g0154781 [Medicago truncatula]|uniref:Transmembrane protein, putative n=1 Tax=Medicago truncatula TaxID=3880 RepID=A0A072VES5_MEDTR|nr:transmembrane protein, putative [Medicago truncatula]RHN77439.1 hypothetical protein MtrunA17_Chr1g0154781 [Medicago truncatula]